MPSAKCKILGSMRDMSTDYYPRLIIEWPDDLDMNELEPEEVTISWGDDGLRLRAMSYSETIEALKDLASALNRLIDWVPLGGK